MPVTRVNGLQIAFKGTHLIQRNLIHLTTCKSRKSFLVGLEKVEKADNWVLEIFFTLLHIDPFFGSKISKIFLWSQKWAFVVILAKK